MAYIANVHFWATKLISKKPQKTRRINQANICFSTFLASPNPYSTFDASKTKSILYKCFLPQETHEISILAQKFYIQFLLDIFNFEEFNFRIRITKNHIFFWVKMSPILKKDKYLLLLIFTLFRYLQEFPEIVNDFYENRQKTIEENFIQFQKSHNNTRSTYYNNRFGHAVIPYTIDNPITYKQFVKNIFNFNINTINNYFIIKN